MKTNRLLLFIAAALFLLSALTYRDTQRRADRFERGQKLITNLNPDEVTEITLRQGEDTTRLRRTGERFAVATADGYPAANDAVNRLLRDILELKLDRRLGAGDSLARELGLVSESSDASADAATSKLPAEVLEIALLDNAGQDMVRFQSLAAERGSYLRRLGGEENEIFLSERPVTVSTGNDDYLDKEILDVQQSEVAAIRGADFAISTPEGSNSLALSELPDGRQENASQMNQVKSLLSGLRFTQQHLANAPEVAGLSFSDVVDFELTDRSGYQLQLASRGDKHYLRVVATFGVTEVAVSPDDDEETVKEKSELLARYDEIQAFNELHGSWVYEVSEFLAEKIRLRRQDLIESS